MGAKNLSREQLLDDAATLRMILEIAGDGFVVVDRTGCILMLSKANERYLGVREEDVLGKHVSKVIPDSRLPIVLKTGQPEIAKIQKIGSSYIVGTRLPIVKDGEVIGAIGMAILKDMDELRALHAHLAQIEKQLKQYKGETFRSNRAKYSFADIVGQSEPLREAVLLARKTASTDSSVLLSGESGTGKELFAHAIHLASRRAEFPFVSVNCSAIPHELLEAELFGYEAGAFTGARREGRIGRFELADGGTMFLDEIGDMPLAMQAKLLRVLQEKEVQKIGSNTELPVNVRIVVATHCNLEELIKKGDFRSDLFFRLNVVRIEIPPLRNRRDDVDLLAQHFVKTVGRRLHRRIDGLAPEALKCLRQYAWPGNIRQLENVIERAINIVEHETVISPRHLPQEITGFASPLNRVQSLDASMKSHEKRIILEALRSAGGKRTRAAQALSISRASLYQRMARLGIGPSLSDEGSRGSTQRSV